MRQILTTSVLILVPLVFFWGCENDTSNDGITGGGGGGGVATEETCLGCHSSQEMLEAALGETSKGSVVVALKDDG